MKYDVILLDVFNLYYRNKGDKNLVLEPWEQAANCVRFINDQVKSYLKKDGYLYLLYDPIIKSDLGLSKKFSYTTYRQSIDPGYKANRHHAADTQEVVRLIYTYFNYRGDHILSVIDNGLEADDYVGHIIEKYPDKNIALYTTDMDWARYLSKKVCIIDSSFEDPFSDTDFKKKYGYYPVESAIIVQKALFGDTSDNITGALKLKKTKFISLDPVDKIGQAFVDQLAKDRTPINEVIAEMKHCSVIRIIDKIERTPLEEVWLLLESAQSKFNPLSQFFDNVRLIKSRCKNVDDYITWHNPNEQINKIIETTLGMAKEQPKLKFGGIKIK